MKRKSYKEYKKIWLGDSDIAALIMAGYSKEDGGLKVQPLHFEEDGQYMAYLVENEYAEEVEIGSHYQKVATFNSWLRIYDDDGLGGEFYGQEINVFRAGMRGCIIQTVGNTI